MYNQRCVNINKGKIIQTMAIFFSTRGILKFYCDRSLQLNETFQKEHKKIRILQA